jgi:hypothetical protein
MPQNISEQDLVSTVFEVLVTHSQNAIVHLFVLSVSCLVSNCVPELGAEKHPDVRPQYAPIQFLRLFPLLQFMLEQPVLFLYFIFFYNCRHCILIHLLDFLPYPYGLGPWHASMGN